MSLISDFCLNLYWLAALPVPQTEELEAKVLAAVVQETIFSQLLRLPESEFGVLAYAKITVSQTCKTCCFCCTQSERVTLVYSAYE